MKVTANAETVVKGTLQAFRHVVDPYHVHTDYPWQQGPASWFANAEIVHDYDLQAIYPAPMRVPHDQTGDDYYAWSGCGAEGLPKLAWTGIGVPLSFRCSHPLGFQELYYAAAQLDADSSYFEGRADCLCQGVTCLWQRYDQNIEYSAAPDNPPYTTWIVEVGAGADARWYSVVFFGQGEIVISKSDDQGASWVDIEKVACGADVWKAAWGESDPVFTEGANPPPSPDPTMPGTDVPSEYNVLEFRLLAGRLEIRVGSQDRIYKYNEARIDADGFAIATINRVRAVAFKYTSLALSAHPTKWTPSAGFDSQEIPIGFTSTNYTTPYIMAAGPVPNGWDAFIDPANSYLAGPIVYYRLLFEGPTAGVYKGRPWADFVAAARAVHLMWLPNIISLVGPDRQAQPEVVDVEFSFNPQDLTVGARGKCTFNNNRPLVLPTGEVGFYGQWVMNYGQNACRIYGERKLNNATDLTATMFTGYGNTASETAGEAGSSKTDMMLQDRSIQLMSPRFALPWMDGWNFFYAMAYMAQQGHVDIGDMAFSPYVPPDPFTDFGDEDGNGAFFLPVGSAGSALTRYSGVHLWEIMKKLAFSIGYVLGFDAFGALQCKKFRVPFGVKRYFYESDHQSGGVNGCWNIATGKNMEEVRSDAIVVGVDAFAPLYDTVAYKVTDPGVQFDINAFNHLGYSNPAVWIDSQFANPYFAASSAFQMMNFMRLPGLFVRLTTWLNPDIAPLDVIQVNADRYGITGLPLLVLKARNIVTKDNGATTITARLAPVL